jgi:hypothetical protein
VNDIIRFMFTTIASTKGIFGYVSLSIQRCRQIIDVLWTMYESLPTILPLELNLTQEATNSLLKRIDQTYKDLIMMDILSRWPNTNGIPLICSSYLLTSSEPTQITEAISSLCHSDCGQMGFHSFEKDDLKKKHLSIFWFLH